MPDNNAPSTAKTAGTIALGVFGGCLAFALFTFLLLWAGCNQIAKTFAGNESKPQPALQSPPVSRPTAPAYTVQTPAPVPDIFPKAPPTPTPLPFTESTPPPDPYAEEARRAAYQERLNAVGNMLVAQGCTVYYNNGTLYVTLPASVALEATPTQAKEIALIAQQRLGDEFAVKVKSPAGQTLATADMWGAR